MNRISKFFLPIAILLVACQSAGTNNDPNTFVIAYLQSSLPGIQYDQNQLLITLNLLNENEGLNLKLIEKVYQTTEDLEEAVLNDSSIDIALLPDFLIERYRQNWTPADKEGDVFTYMPEFEENKAPYFISILERMYRTEEFNPKDLPRYLDTFIPYTFGHLGVAYNQEEYPLRLRRIEDVLSFVPVDQLVFNSDIRTMNYVASLLTYREELNQAFELFNTDKINLFQYQSILSSYLNTSDSQTSETLKGFSESQLINHLDGIPNRHVYIGPSHSIGKDLIKEDNAYRFEYLRDASLMYFNGFVFLNDLAVENYSRFIDGLYNASTVNQTIALTHQSIVVNHPNLLNQFMNAAEADGLLQTDYTYWFDTSVNQTQNMIFSYDRVSMLSTIYPNQAIHDTSVIKYNLILDPVIEAYRQNFNPNYGLTNAFQFNPLYILLIPIPPLMVVFVIFLSKKNFFKKPKKELEIKPYKLRKAILKQQKLANKARVEPSQK